MTSSPAAKAEPNSSERKKTTQSPNFRLTLAGSATPALAGKVFRESCLDLSEGDIVEVIAGRAYCEPFWVLSCPWERVLRDAGL